MRTRSATLLVLTLSAFAPGAARAQEDDPEGERIYAIQGRKHLLGHEFAAALGVLPMDAFFKGMTFSGSYTYHFDELWAWEAVQGAYAHNFATDLERQLEDNFGVRPTQQDQVTALISSNAVVKPLYGKLAALNRRVLYAEVFAVAGPSLARVNGEFRPGGDVGLGVRFFLSQLVTVRFDARELVHADDGGTRNDLWFGLGIALNVGRGGGAAK